MPREDLDENPAASDGPLDVLPFEGPDDRWNNLMGGFPGTTFCHLAGWRHVMSDVLGHDTGMWVAVDRQGSVRGALPLVRVRSRLFGDYLLSMPFLSYGGPVGSEGAKRVLVEHAVREAGRKGVDLLELRSRQRLPGDLRVSDRKITVLKKLPASSEELWEAGLRSKVRSQVRRPMKAGMDASFGPESLEDFYGVFSHTMRDLGTPVLPHAFFRAVSERLSPQVIFCTVRSDDGTAAAAGCGFHWQDEVEITWAGALRDYSRQAPNMLLYWSFMEEAIRRGARRFNFGRCTPGSGTHRFKKQWGTEDAPLPWAQWSPGSVTETPSPTGWKYEMATSVWSRLPVSVTKRLGPLISPSLP